jgi:protein-L-isoaspartate(D-aspartate) O-methyltransferase
MTEVPRERFVPTHPRPDAYADKVLVTKWDETGLAISSASRPAIVATMLEQLDIQPHHNVLEIGAGTGYNAALLGRLAGRVITLDIDREIARVAGDHLAQVGNVEVRVGDGWTGAPDRAPFDRIQLTVGSSDISPVWRDQLADGGLLVMPLWLRVGVQVSVAFRRDGDVLRGESVRDCGFQRLRGVNAGPEGFVPICDGTFVVLNDTSDGMALAELLRRPPATELAPVIDPAVYARFAMDEPRTFAVLRLPGQLCPGLYGPGACVVIDGDRMLTYGSPAARDRFARALRTSRPLDRSRLRVTATFGPPPESPTPPRGWRFVRRSCVVDIAEG